MYHFEIGRLLGEITHRKHSRGKELQIWRLPGNSGVLALYQYCNTKQQPVHSAQILVFVSKLCFLSNISLFQHGSLSFHITSYRSYSSIGVKGKIYKQNTVTMLRLQEKNRQTEKWLPYWCVFCAVVFCLMVWSWTEQFVASTPLCTTLCEYTEHTDRQTESDTKTSYSLCTWSQKLHFQERHTM